ncbi:DUF7511 domain-containing protein [Halomontanus rarus]|uniref:DUF7511 domain-containing protein n=1 Tax=Halomontanus rarus TaxID=3034020 RepID=UPI0023E8184B|nr:hypothetical protein [Halovivax sp. TS33]
MTAAEAPVGRTDDEQRRPDIQLELLTDDEVIWTVVPVETTGDEQLTRWLSVPADILCDLAAWR